jgi:hypothetical protein
MTHPAGAIGPNDAEAGASNLPNAERYPHAQMAEIIKRKPCEYLDREGHRGAGCLLEFEVNGGPGGSNRIYCDNCQVLAARHRSRKSYAKSPEASKKRGKARRRKIAEADGRDYRPMDTLQSCLYLDRAGKPGPNCIGMFKPKTGIQIYCDNCRPLAINKRQGAAAVAQYHADKEQFDIGGDPEACARHEQRLKRGKKSAAAYNKRLHDQIAEAKRQNALRPTDWFEKPIEYRIVGDALISREGHMGNQELADRLDASRILKCPYAATWKIALSRPGRAANFVSDVRKWMRRPGRTLIAK